MKEYRPGFVFAMLTLLYLLWLALSVFLYRWMLT